MAFLATSRHPAILGSTASPRYRPKRALALALATSCWVSLSACASDPGATDASGADSSTAVTPCPDEANLLLDPTFASLSGGPRVWSSRQHSRGRDFAATAESGALKIEKIGHEPWFVFSQRLDQAFPADAELQFDAQVAFATHEPVDGHEFGYYTGLYLVGQAGRATVFRASADHAPNLGEHPEQRVVTTVRAEKALTRLEAGFIHQAGGYFTVREPRLIDISRYPECKVP